MKVTGERILIVSKLAQEKRLAREIAAIEMDTGFKLRVLAQNYPDTPGLAIRDFWNVDDRTIVFVADPTFGNILNFNVGASVDLDIPRSFWSRLAGKYGNLFYWKEKGEDSSIEAAVMAIASCLREPIGLNNCSEGHWHCNLQNRRYFQPFAAEFSLTPRVGMGPYSSSACFRSLKNEGFVKNPNSTTNLCGVSVLTAKTAKYPSFTSSGSNSVAFGPPSNLRPLAFALLEYESGK